MSIYTDGDVTSNLNKVIGQLTAIAVMQNEYFQDYLKAEYEWEQTAIINSMARLSQQQKEIMEVFE